MSTFLKDHFLEDYDEDFKRKKVKSWRKLLAEYEEEFEEVDERHKQLSWYIDRLHGMIERVGG